MGLDAVIFCDCYERGRTKTPPPNPRLVHVLPNGNLDCRSKNADVLAAFDEWRESACRHPDGFLAGEELGNIWSVEDLRDALASRGKFPVLLGKVLYSGSHTGDHLALRSVEKLQTELQLLKPLRTSDKSLDKDLQILRRQLSRLVAMALKVRNPIAF